MDLSWDALYLSFWSVVQKKRAHRTGLVGTACWTCHPSRLSNRPFVPGQSQPCCPFQEARDRSHFDRTSIAGQVVRRNWTSDYPFQKTYRNSLNHHSSKGNVTFVRTTVIDLTIAAEVAEVDTFGCSCTVDLDHSDGRKGPVVVFACTLHETSKTRNLVAGHFVN